MAEQVICHHCKKPIESKADLLVMRKWWILPRPLHKQCWGELFLSKGGLGTISFQTGVFRSKQAYHTAINSALFTVLSIIVFFLGIFLVLAIDFSTVKFVVEGVQRNPSFLEALGIRIVIFLLFSIPIIQRVYSYNALEKKLQ